MVPAKDTTLAGAPAVLIISSGIWLVLGAAGTLWTLMGLLMVLAFGGMVAPQTYLPALALYLASGTVFVSGVVLSVLLGRGRRIARLVLSGYVAIVPAVLYFRGGPPSVQLPWREVLLSPAGAAGLLAVLATVLMWLPPANAYFARADAHARETPAGSEHRTARVPPAVTAAVWILVGSGVIAALEAVLGLLLLWGTSGSGANTTPALVLYLTLASVAVANFACANAVRRGKLFVRPLVTTVPVAGLVLVVVAAVTASSSAPAGSPAAAGGPTSAILLAVLSQGLPLIGGLVAALLVWLPSAGLYFRRGGGVHPAATTVADTAAPPPAPG
jgi:hypothetical protein